MRRANVLTASGPLGQAQAVVNADNELTTWTQAVTQVTVTGQVDPGPRSNKWYASTAAARGKSATVSTSDGSFGVLGVPVSSGANALTVNVTDVSGNIATQIVNFTVGSSQTTVFGYDANGNLTNSGTGVSPVFSYQYDAENRLVRAVSNSVTVLQCWYDGAGHRIAKREITGSQTNTVQYVWDGWEMVAVLGSDGQLKEHYTRGVGIAGDIGTLVAVTHYSGGSPSATYYLHNNHRGDVILAREGSSTMATLDYTPYGELRSQTGNYQPRFRFSSKEYDASTGFYHFPYRHYAPQWARWITRDPLKDGAGVNPYKYARNRPVNLEDPMGLEVYGGASCGCPNGEGVAMVQAVGPFFALLAAQLRYEAESVASASGLHDPHNGLQDAFRHCYWSCRMTQVFGAERAKKVGDTHELCGNDPVNESVMDLKNNAMGRSLGTPTADCESACKSAALNGDLTTLP